MKSYKEYSNSKLSEAVTINDNIWAYLNKEIDGLFEKLKDTVKDMTMPRRDWLKNVHKWLYDKRYGTTNEDANSTRLNFTLSEHNNINSLLEELSLALREADAGADFSHIDGMLDMYKDKFKEIIKNLFARIRVNPKNATKPGVTAAVPPVPSVTTSPLATPTKPVTSPITDPHADDITKPLQEPENTQKASDDIMKEPQVVPMAPAHTPAPAPVKPIDPVDHAPLDSDGEDTPTVGGDEKEPAFEDPVHSNDPHQKAHEDELIKLGIFSTIKDVYDDEDKAMSAAEKALDTITEPEERARYIKSGQEYLRNMVKNGEETTPTKPTPAMAAHGLDMPKEDHEKTELLAKYRKGKAGQRSIRRMIKRHAPELLTGHYIKAHNVEQIIDAYLKKKRANKESPGGIKETVEYYRELLRSPIRTVSLLDESEQIDTIKGRIAFYKDKLKLARS